MTKVRICSVLILALFLSTQFVSAESMKIGVVDLQRALNSVEEGKSARDKFKKELEATQKETDKRKAELETLKKELDDLSAKAQSGMLKPEAIEQGRKKQADFQKKFEAYGQYVEKTQSELARKEQEATQGILARLKPLVDDIGRSDGFHLIFEKNQSGLLYAASYTDVTERLIQQFNKTKKK